MSVIIASIILSTSAICWFIYKKFFENAVATTRKRPHLFDDVAKKTSVADATINEYSLYLIAKCDTTAACQFEAARRMQKKNMASTISIVILSMYAILFSLMPSFDKIPRVQQSKDMLGMISIFMSVFIIAFSLYEMLKRYDLRSALFLKSARTLQELRDQVLALHLARSEDLSKFVEIDKHYHKTLKDHDDNHSHLDYDIVRVQKRELVGLRAVEVTMLRLLNVWMVPLLALLAPLIIAWLYVYVTNSLAIFSPNPNGLQ